MVNKKNPFVRIIAVFAVILLLLSGCAPNNNINNTNNDSITDNGNTTSLSLDANRVYNGELKKFLDSKDLIKYLTQQQFTQITSYDMVNSRATKSVDSMAENALGQESANADVSGGSSANIASDYSETNVQVKGVDEADIVKNDGKYIYTLTQNELVIVDAFPAENAKVLSEIKFNGTTHEMFLNKDKIVVFTDDYDKIEKVSDYSFVPEWDYIQKTHVYIYDVKDREKPQLIKDYSITGNYYDARMIDDEVYIIAKESAYLYKNYINTPVIFDGNVKVANPEIYYFDTPSYSYNFHTIASFNLNDNKLDLDAKTFMLGYSNNLYVSKDNIYVSYDKYYSYSRKDQFDNAVLPLLGRDVQNKIKALDDDKLSENEYFDKITTILEDMYNNMEEKDKEKLVEDIQDSIEEYNYKLESERSKSVIHKISIDNGKIEYVTKGEVNGHLLNQFSLDENNGNLRVATTTSFWSRKNGSITYNNVYVLDDNLKQIGELEKLAEDERIYSTRFIGDKLYMVTFRQIDPLFVIDLSDAKNPQVLGKLKIPGYSDYLHPYDENYLIGIGKATKESEWGGVVDNGVKLSLFDISDFENPKEVDSYIIKGRWTDSTALHDHKAFLFDKDKNLLAIPVREFIGDEKDYSSYDYKQGAYVFTIDTSGFNLRGVITHEDKEEGSNYWYYSPNSIKRILFMDDILYTISDKKILMNDIESIDKVNEVKLPYDENYNYYPYYYRE